MVYEDVCKTGLRLTFAIDHKLLQLHPMCRIGSTSHMVCHRVLFSPFSDLYK